MATPLIEGHQKENEPRKEDAPPGPCSPHHWVCDAAAGPESDAYCKKCGVGKSFNNYLSRENVDALKKERYEQYLARKEHPLKPIVTELPLDKEDPPRREEKGHAHDWDIGLEDVRGISHMRCITCPVEMRVDEDGNLYDEQGFLLYHQMVKGETGKARVEKEVTVSKRSKDWDDRLPEIVKRLEELGSVGALAKELGIPYTQCANKLKVRGIDLRKYQTGRQPIGRAAEAINAGDVVEVGGGLVRKAPPGPPPEPPASSEPGLPPVDLAKALATMEALYGKLRPEPVEALLRMLPVQPAMHEKWKAAFLAAFDLVYAEEK